MDTLKGFDFLFSDIPYRTAIFMDENQRTNQTAEQRNRHSEKKEKHGFYTVTMVQLVLFLILTVVIFAVSKTGGQTAVSLKNDFSNLMNWKTVENAGEALSAVKQFLSEPFTLLPAFSPIESTETGEIQEETEVQTSEEQTTEALQETSQTQNVTEAAAESTTETAAESTNEDMGGEDIEVYKAADNASFSPVATTCAIVKPVDSNRYTSYFGYRINPITNKKAFHTGLDIAAPLGTKIKAAYSGTVRKTGEDSHSGKYIFLSHDDGFETFYCHCSEILAEEGAVIRQGETIAKVGSTGWSTGPHLHFEIRRDGTRLNPLSVLENADS